MTIQECLDVLDIHEPPTKTIIKQAFRRAALITHPDNNGDSTRFITIKTAYDTLAALDPTEPSSYQHIVQPKRSGAPPGRYDPFKDPEYHKRVFFTPENPRTEGFERKLRAEGCPHCHELGYMTKITDPERGFMSRERRFCKCQWA